MVDEIGVVSFRGNWEINVLKGYFISVPNHFAALMHTCIVPDEKVLF